MHSANKQSGFTASKIAGIERYILAVAQKAPIPSSNKSTSLVISTSGQIGLRLHVGDKAFEACMLRLHDDAQHEASGIGNNTADEYTHAISTLVLKSM